MKRGVLWLIVLAIAACGAPPGRPPGGALRDLFESATLKFRQGDLGGAQTLAERGVERTRAQPESEWAWTFGLLRAEILIARNELAEAAPLLGATIPPDTGTDTRYAPLRSRQEYLAARVALSQGKPLDALDTLARARQVAPRASEVGLDIDILDGQIRFRLSRWAEGESLLNAVAGRAAAASDHYHQAQAFNNLGMEHVVRNRFDEALPWFERILSLTDLERLTEYSKAMYNAGICYTRLGRFDRAIVLQRRAVDIYDQRGSSREREEALGELGNTYVLRGTPEEGLPYLQRAVDVATEANLTAAAALWTTNLAGAYVSLGKWDEAERFNEQAKRLKTATHSGKLVHNTLKSAAIAAGRGRLDEARGLFEVALAEADTDPAVRWTAHAGIANVWIAARQPRRAATHFEAALQTIEQSRSELLKTDYKLSYLTQLIDFYRAYVDALIDDGQIERALEIADSSRGRVLAERQGGTAPVRARAPALRRLARQSGTVWLSYWLAPSRSYLWIVAPEGIRVLRLPPSKEIEALVREHQSVLANVLADPLASPGAAGDRLYRLLVEPAMPAIHENASVLIVPDGALHGLNFETLVVDGVRRHYWIEDVELQVAPSLASLTAKTAATPPGGSLLLVGDATPRPPEFPALRYAAVEMTNVAKHFDPGRVVTFTSAGATPAAYRDAEPARFAFVHFTAHASANVESPLDSAVVLSGPDEGHKLYARDVAEQPLRAELVTVSACRSAGERAYSGEGLVGFSWAFLRAGAHRVIAGLWDVDDRSTADLMDGLYAGVAAGDPVARALRAAKLGFIRRGGPLAKPYYWASFELFTIVS